MGFVITPPTQPSLAVSGTVDRFPVRRIFCVGRNYAEHAREMGNDPDREPPFFFTKPADAALDVPDRWPYPPETENLHHEVELVVAIGKGGVNISSASAEDHIWGYAVGLDMTRRDLQMQAKKAGRPWDWGKAFDHSAPCGPIVSKARCGNISSAGIWLDVNGTKRQQGKITDMIWPVNDVISFISHSMALQAGDLIMTGTPAGVGPVVAGDVINAGIDSLVEIRMAII